jgi:hypothetical protein
LAMLVGKRVPREWWGSGVDVGEKCVYSASCWLYTGHGTILTMVHDVDRGKGAAIEHKVKVAYVVNLATSVLPQSMTLFGVSKRSNRFLA